jgi:membrane glycosyltransferase
MSSYDVPRPPTGAPATVALSFTDEDDAATEQSRATEVSSLLPPDRPLPMPVQDFWSLSPEMARKGRVRADATARLMRVIVFGLALVLTGLFAWKLYTVMAIHALTPVQAVFLALCTMSFAWVALGSVSAVAGFIGVLRPRVASVIGLPEGHIVLTEKTALLFPVYHEEPARIAATIEAMTEDLVALGANAAFDVFVLSDSREPASREAELAIFSALAQKLEGRTPIYYRCREVNTGKKAGNIADWIKRFGAGSAHFLVLDADSVMDGRLVVQLAAAMEQHPKVGLIQSVPRLAGSRSLFARLQQFASNVYGPVVATGLAVWHRGQSNYWGHNAIIRTKAFAEAAGLPALSGRPPLGGHIQSHDFVEAALLQRAGWEVHMTPTSLGSYEGCPPGLIDLVVRDRRWAQGNLQHSRILFAKGLSPLSRVHLGMGILSYVSSVLWGLSLVVGIVLALQSKQFIPSYFSDEVTLFPIWPEMDAVAAFTLFVATIAVVMLPKVLGAILVLRSPEQRRASGGALRLIGGVLVETVFSILIAPILMVTQSTAVVQILAGRDSGWKAQRRDDGGVALGQAVRFHWWHVVVGLVAGILCWQVSPQVAGWMSPVVLGLMLAVLLTWWTSRPTDGLLARMLATREDLSPPDILSRSERYLDAWRAWVTATPHPRIGGADLAKAA